MPVLSKLSAHLRAACLIAASSLVACSASDEELALGHAEQRIVRGQIDTEHPQVMLLANRTGFVCTGTLIEVHGRTGFLLTAAHCATDEVTAAPLPANQYLVIPGVDFATSPTAFAVDAVRVQPEYDGSFASNDVAIVRFSFGAETPPAPIPPLTSESDELDTSNNLLLVGYGQTELTEENSLRRHVARRISEIDDELVVYPQGDGKGACFGDSGGPGLVELDGEERVAAVISGGIDDTSGRCEAGFGVAMRASAFEDFIADVLAER